MKHHQDSWSQRYNLNPGPREYQAAVLTTWPKISVPEMVTADILVYKKEIWVMILKR
jgi:hypothetical protein